MKLTYRGCTYELNQSSSQPASSNAIRHQIMPVMLTYRGTSYLLSSTSSSGYENDRAGVISTELKSAYPCQTSRHLIYRGVSYTI